MTKKTLLLRNKKGLDYYSPLVAIVGVFVLIAVLGMVMLKQYRLAAEFDLGREQLRLFHTYSTADKMLSFVDDSARLSLERAAYKYGKSGFHSSAPVCGSSNGFNLWTREQSLKQNDCVPQLMPCYPDEAAMNPTFRSFFSAALESFVKSFNDTGGFEVDKKKVELPFDYEFELQPVSGRTEVVGISGEPVTITSAAANPLKYEIKPNFRESITPDVIADGNAVVSKAPQLLRKKKDEIISTLGSFNSQNPALQWKLASYSTPPTSCPHTIGTCTYCDEYQDVCVACEDDPCCSITPICTKSHEGEEVEVVSYNDVYVVFSVANGKSFYVSDPPSSQPQLKGISYDFGLNWLEETGRSTTCAP